MKPARVLQPHSLGLLRLLQAATLLSSLLAASVQAQSAGSIAGVVTDQLTSGYLVGAEVRVAGTDLSAATARDGSFTLNNVPTGPQTLEVSYVGRKTKSVPVNVTAGTVATTAIDLGESDVLILEAVTVESVREGQSRAINQQRTSNTIMNVISSDSIGNLPDQTVGEALARLAGVSVVIDGASAFASIRGAEAKLNSVTLDGAHISSPANNGIFSTGGFETRAVDLSTIPSDMIGSIEVIKALTPDRDADAFGGQVNMVTRSAFDLPGRSINGRVEYRVNSLRNDDGYAFNLNYSDVLNAARTLGVTATLSYSDEKYGQNDYEIAYFDAGVPPVNTIPGITNQAITEFDQRFRRIERKNLGGNLNFDYRLGDATQLYLKVFHNESETDSERYRLRQRGFAAFAANSTDLRASGANARNTRRLDVTKTERSNDRIAVGGKTKLPEGTLSYELNYGIAELDARARRYQFETAAALRGNIDWVIDRGEPLYPRISMIDRSTREQSVFRSQDMALNQVRFHFVKAEDEDLVAKLDYDFAQRVAQTPVQWKVGAKFRGKDRKHDGDIADYAPVAPAPLQSSFSGGIEPRNLFEGRVATLGPFPTIDSVFNGITQNPNAYTVANGDETTQLAISRYTASEDVSSLYGMGTAQFGKLQVVGGARYEKTEIDYIFRPTPAATTKGGSSYDNVFPSVVFNYRFNRNLVLRGAWTNTMSRPDYGDLIPYESNLDPEPPGELDDAGALPRIYKGNSNLKAQKSMNWDASLEWYYQPTGMLSVAVFHKDIKDFIYKGVSRESRPPLIVAVYQNLNGGKQNLDGIELTWVQSLSMLPAPLNGFGFSANATFIRGESEFPTVNLATGATGKRTQDFVPSQPETVYNLQVYWEKFGFTARVGINYIDEFVREWGGLAGAVTTNDATRVDAQVSYRLNKHLSLYVEGKNLTEEKKRWYNNTPSRPEELEYRGWDGIAGVRFRF